MRYQKLEPGLSVNIWDSNSPNHGIPDHKGVLDQDWQKPLTILTRDEEKFDYYQKITA